METDLLDDNALKTTESMIKKIEFPLHFSFKLSSLANDFTVKDNKGVGLAYVRQKMFKFKEAISVFKDESKSETLYTIDADRIIDFNATYAFTDHNSEVFGKIARKGMKSLLKAHYNILDKDNQPDFFIQEENPWAKFFDAMIGEVPIAGLFSGLMFNPRYVIKNNEEQIVARFSKEKSFFGRKFKLEKYAELNDQQIERIILSLMMMALLERRRG